MCSFIVNPIAEENTAHLISGLCLPLWMEMELLSTEACGVVQCRCVVN